MPRRLLIHLLTWLPGPVGYRHWPESKVMGMRVHESLIELFGKLDGARFLAAGTAGAFIKNEPAGDYRGDPAGISRRD